MKIRKQAVGNLITRAGAALLTVILCAAQAQAIELTVSNLFGPTVKLDDTGAIINVDSLGTVGTIGWINNRILSPADDNENVYFINRDNGQFGKVDIDGVASLLGTVPRSNGVLGPVTRDPATGFLYSLDRNSRIEKITVTPSFSRTTLRSFIASGDWYKIHSTPDGKLIAHATNGTVAKIDPNTGANIAPFPVSVAGIIASSQWLMSIIDPVTGDLYMVHNGGDLAKVTPTGGVSLLTTLAGGTWQGGMAIDSQGDLYVGKSNTIRKVDTTSGANIIFASARPVSMGFDGNDNLYLVDSNFGVRVINPAGVVSDVADLGAYNAPGRTFGWLGLGLTASTTTPDVPPEIITDIEDLIMDPATPAAALKDLNKALDKLNKAQEKLNEGDTEKALKELAKAAKELEKAADDGADVADILTALVDFARGLAEDAAEDAWPLAGTNFRVDGFLAAMEATLIKAESQAALGNAEKAIKAFKDAVKNANDAAAAVPHGELEDTAQEVIYLLNDPATPAAAQPDLLKAIGKLEKAQEHLDAGDTAKGVKEMAKAAKELEKAANNGAAAAGFVVEDLVELARSLANAAADAARPLAGTNAEVNEKLAKMEAKLVKAEEKAAAGDFDKAIEEFSGAVKEADNAFLAAAP